MTEQIRTIHPQAGDGPRADYQMTEGEIAKFCAGCDSLQSDNSCVGGSNDQGRYARRQWCGWASTNGERGFMTGDGFERSKQLVVNPQ